jgi:murein DD-endopeptidase MepM/ murein hydrolase activator NlpD
MTVASPPMDDSSSRRAAPPQSTASASKPAPRAITCPACSGPVDVKTPHVAVYKGSVRTYCSAACLEARDPIPVDVVSLDAPPKRKRRIWTWLIVGLAVTGTSTALFLQRDLEQLEVPPPPSVTLTQPPADPEANAPPAGNPQQEADTALVNELMHDAWIHPLAGPTRRMPHNHNGAFGAERGGERPPECVSGHCGVDVGSEWGERVYAVHDGVIDFVNRGPNEERGGLFVRIAHRDGTLFSWYFHLAAIPRSIRAGDKVKAGQLIGLLGDTGVKHSAPHLHFALSVRTGKHAERYLDPEPLIAIWPLWIPNEKGGRLSMEEPGVPVRAGGGGGHRKAKQKAEAAEATSADSAPEAAVPPASAETVSVPPASL